MCFIFNLSWKLEAQKVLLVMSKAFCVLNDILILKTADVSPLYNLYIYIILYVHKPFGGFTMAKYFTFFSLIFVLLQGNSYSDSNGYLVGISKISITPQKNIWMSGYAARTKPAEGKEHDLYAKAVAIQDSSKNTILLITSDLIGMSRSMTNRISQKIQKEFDLPRESIMFTFSHTHSGPVLRSNLEITYNLNERQWDDIQEYSETIETKYVELVKDTLRKLVPVKMYRGNGTASFGINRREFRPEGVRIGINPIGPVDHDVPVLKIENNQNETIAIVFGYACHNTTLSYYKYCGDYAGFAQIELESEYPKATALFWAGCGGDINPNPRREVDHAKQHGKSLSNAVCDVLQGKTNEIDGLISASIQEVDIPLTKAPTKNELHVQMQSKNPYIQRRANFLLKQIDEHGEIPEQYPYTIQVWKIGDDFKWIGLAGEVVVDYSLLLKKKYGKDNVWVTAYANDVFAYVPSMRVLFEGGYEANDSMIYYGLHGPWKPEVEPIILSGVDELVKN
jgi:neutral ceramidase